MNFHNVPIFLSTWLCFLSLQSIVAQRTLLDTAIGSNFRTLRLLGLQFVGDTNRNIVALRRSGKVLKPVPKDIPFYCDTKNGPGRRSEVTPASVNRLRPGDIDIIAALGDSLTAGNGIYAARVLDLFVENRGSVFSIGGEKNWRNVLALPNILKEFNPKLYGFSLGNAISTDYASKFNVAEAGAMSRDLPYEAEVLVKRLKADPMVNMTHHWKLLTIFIGSNDFCSEMCHHSNPRVILKLHESDLVKTLRFLRANVPRLYVNIIPPPNLNSLTKVVGLSPLCQKTHTLECPCLSRKSTKLFATYVKIMRDWAALDSEIAHRDEFNTETFAVNFQPITLLKELPKTPNGQTDFRLLSADCFHFSQRGHAFSAISLWNSMLEPDGSKTIGWSQDVFKCPTIERPYLVTNMNTKSNDPV